jgi:hypothetical protein
MQKIGLLLDICTPQRMATFLVYLNANLGPTSRAKGRRGRPKNLAVQRVQEALQAAGRSYRDTARVLQSEGLVESSAEVEDVRERVRARRRRGGRKEDTK